MDNNSLTSVNEITFKSLTAGNTFLNKIKDKFNGDNVPVNADTIDISNRAESLLQKYKINRYFSFNGDEFRFHKSSFKKDFEDQLSKEFLEQWAEDNIHKFVSHFNHSIRKFTDAGKYEYTIEYTDKDNFNISIHRVGSSNEGFIEDFENFKKKRTDIKALEDQWDKAADQFQTHVWLKRYITDKQKAMLNKYYDIITDEDSTYGEYKRAFNIICRFMGLPNKGVIIENLIFQKDKRDRSQEIVAVMYSKGLVQVKIPDDVSLVHISPVDNITELMPSFRSKRAGRYLYPSKRVYFTIELLSGTIDPDKAGLVGQRVSKYTPKEHISTAYIDPTYTSSSDGSVYVETDKPIPVKKIK